MRKKTKWQWTMSIVVVFLVITQLDLTLFAAGAENQPRIRAAEPFVAPAQAGAPSATTPAQSEKAESKPSRRPLWRWILIGAGVAAVVTAVILHKPAEPVVTVGVPTVGSPQ